MLGPAARKRADRNPGAYTKGRDAANDSYQGAAARPGSSGLQESQGEVQVSFTPLV